MKMMPLLALLFPLVTGSSIADDLTRDAAIGGGLGGALGGALGAEVGGREGAIVGSGIGAAIGAAAVTSDHGETLTTGDPKARTTVVYRTEKRHPVKHHCPPGQAKKGKC